MSHIDRSIYADCEPSCLFFVGQDSRGHWIAQDSAHRRGGIFVSRKAAMRYATLEMDGNANGVLCTNQRIELDLAGRHDADRAA